MARIEHCGPKRTSETVQEAQSLLNAIANGLTLKSEFRLVYDKSPAGSELRLQMIAPKVEVVDGVSVDSENKAAIDGPDVSDSKKPRNASPKPAAS